MDERQKQERQKQTVFEPAKVIAIGIASPAAAFLTSRFGVASTLLGLALSAMILTAVADFLKVYLARTSQAAVHAATHAATAKVPGVTKAPRGLLARLFRRKGRARPKAPHRGFSSPPPAWRRRRWFFLVGRSVVAAGISFVLALGVVTALELGEGKCLSCWAWEECAAEPSSADEGSETSEDKTTLASVFGGGGPTASSDASGVRPGAGPPQQRSATPSEAAGSEASGSAAGDRWWDQSEQQQRQQDSYYYSEDYEQQSSSPSTTEEGQQREDRNGGFADRRNEITGEPEIPSVPWST